MKKPLPFLTQSMLLKGMTFTHIPLLLNLHSGVTRRWKLWAMFTVVVLVAAIGTYVSGQYQIGKLDSLKGRYDQPIGNYARFFADAPNDSLERDLLEGCKQAQIGTWLQTTEALRFDGPLTGNRVDVRLDASKAYIDLNGQDMAECVTDEVEDRQFDIGSMTTTWAIILTLLSFCLGVWTWICYVNAQNNRKSRNIYAETLAAGTESALSGNMAGDTSPELVQDIGESHETEPEATSENDKDSSNSDADNNDGDDTPQK